MANEITLNGEIAIYGGGTITLAGSTIGNAVISILAREGTGTARAWKIFDPTKASFLNTKTTLSYGDKVLVNAKVLPMDFPLISGVAPSTDTGVLTINAGESPKYFDISMTSRTKYAAPAFITGGGTITYEINGSAVADITAVNNYIDSLTDAALVVGKDYFTFVVNTTNNSAAVAEFNTL
jgi:hypothetical protein